MSEHIDLDAIAGRICFVLPPAGEGSGWERPAGISPAVRAAMEVDAGSRCELADSAVGVFPCIEDRAPEEWCEPCALHATLAPFRAPVGTGDGGEQ